MNRAPNIFLVGPMGAGKTTIGKLLARELGWEFRDSDWEIENRTGVRIPTIFEYEGEDGFRKREAEAIAFLSSLQGVVVATGGGAVLLPGNRDVLAARGFVVYLKCSVDKQLERTHKDPNRPLLQTANPRQRLHNLMSVRDPLYHSVADFVIDTGRSSSRSVVRAIIKAHVRAKQNVA